MIAGMRQGVARIRGRIPGVKVIGVDPEGSILGGGDPGGPYKVEGIGYDFFPDVFDGSLVDEFIKTTDGPSFELALKLIREEGMLVGISSGANLAGDFLEAARPDVAEQEILLHVIADEDVDRPVVVVIDRDHAHAAAGVSRDA